MGTAADPIEAMARMIAGVVGSCRTEAQLETARRYVLLACRRYKADFLPLLGLAMGSGSDDN